MQAKMQMVNKSMVGIVGALDRALATNNLEKVPPDLPRHLRSLKNGMAPCHKLANQSQSLLGTPVYSRGQLRLKQGRHH